jgi:hypothetical protein
VRILHWSPRCFFAAIDRSAFATNSCLGIWLGGAALAHTRLSFVPSGPASSSFFRFDVLATVHLYDPL